MNIELFATIVVALVIANLINQTIINPIIMRMFGGAEKKIVGLAKGESSIKSPNVK
jgi:hypothetical protein